MLSASVLAEEMERVLAVCPPYESPGTTSYASIMSGAGCDCSGVPAAIFKRYGGSLYHGSNTIARKYSIDLQELKKVDQLRVGMAVYKWSASGEPAKYVSDGMGNFQHIGVVTSVSPLRIVHQSSAAGHTACDTSIKRWKYCSSLVGVDYADEQVDPVISVISVISQEENAMYELRVTADALRIREEPSTKAAVLGSFPRGTICMAVEQNGGWYKLTNSNGWICGRQGSKSYVEVLSSNAEETASDDVIDAADDAIDEPTLTDILDAFRMACDALEQWVVNHS